MKTIGLLGGMSWKSTLEYYRLLNELTKAQLGGLHSAPCAIYSVDFHQIARLQGEDKWEDLKKLMIDYAQKIQNCGAQALLICANTMHKLAEAIQEHITIPLLHIVDATAQEIKKCGITKAALLETRLTMEESFYRERISGQHGIEVLIPPENHREMVERIIFGELVVGKMLEESKKTLVKIMAELVHLGAEGIILDCTEIPLLVKQEDSPVPLFDTMLLHAKAAVQWALSP